MWHYIRLYVGGKRTGLSSEPARWSCDNCQRMSDFDSCQSNHAHTDGWHNWQASVKLCKIYCDIWHQLTLSVCTGGRTLRHNQFSRTDSLTNFVTHGAPLRARELRYKGTEKKEKWDKMVFQFENHLISFFFFHFFNVPLYIIEQDESQTNVGAWVIDSLKNAIRYG